MTSFAFNTLIGQITAPAMQHLHYRYYILFIICNATNALFFYLFLPETARLPLEEMNYLFAHAPWLVPGAEPAAYGEGLRADLERRAREIEGKGEGLGESGHDELA